MMKSCFLYIHLVDFDGATVAIKGATNMTDNVTTNAATNATTNATSRDYDTTAAATAAVDDDDDGDDDDDENFLHGLATTNDAFDKNWERVMIGTIIKDLKIFTSILYR